MTMRWRKSPESLVRTFEAIVPDGPGIERRKMFGYPAAFAGGNLFMSLFQDSLVLRLSDDDRTAFLRLEGAARFEPMPGRPMREYVVAPAAMVGRRRSVEPWIRRSLDYVRSLPAKGGRARAGRSKPAKAAPRGRAAKRA